MLALRPGKSSLARSRSPSVFPPTKELEEALSIFEKSLSGERHKQFQALRSADDSYDTNAAQILLASVKKEKDSRRRSRALLKIQSFLEAVQEFSAIVDSIAGINPIAGAVWGGVKLFIVYAIKFTHFTDDLTTCLNQVQNVCPRFKAYGSLYQSSQELKQAICDYYVVVFKFITKAICELDKSGLSAAWSYIKSPLKSELSEFKDDLTKSGESVNLYIVFAKGQADATAQEEVRKHNSLVKKAWDQLLKREQDQRLVKERNSASMVMQGSLLHSCAETCTSRVPAARALEKTFGPRVQAFAQGSSQEGFVRARWTLASQN